MNYRYLGKTGLKVSELCLGAMTFGRENEATEEESFQMMDRFVAAGGNFIDTANVYSTGISEEIVGRWLKKQRRDDLVIATKVRFPMGTGPNDLGLSRKHILSSVEASLRRLQTDYIDLYQVHCWDEKTPLEETLSTLNDLVRKGVVRYVGASNFAGWQLQRAIDLSRENGWEVLVCLQPQYNLLCRSTEWELIPLCRREGLGVIPWSPLRGGWLSGKFKRGMTAPPEGSRIELAEKKDWGEKWSAYNNEPDVAHLGRFARGCCRGEPVARSGSDQLAAAEARGDSSDHRGARDQAARKQPRFDRMVAVSRSGRQSSMSRARFRSHIRTISLRNWGGSETGVQELQEFRSCRIRVPSVLLHLPQAS